MDTQAHYTTGTLISSLKEHLNDWKEAAAWKGSDLTRLQEPVGYVALDLLRAAGIPENGIKLIMGAELYQELTATEPKAEGGADLTCLYCDEPAAHLIYTQNNGPLLGCEYHSEQAVKAGFKIS